MTQRRITAEFIGEPGQRIFVLAHHPESFAGRCVLVCPPFAEEMNKSRKMLTELAKQLVEQGVALVIFDLYGTGDSEGDFADATWQRWLSDVRLTEQWLQTKGWQVASLLGIRTGCLLAAQYAQLRTAPVQGTIFWQPVLDGARALDHFLRLRVAALLMNDDRETIAMLKEQFATGATVEVAGYGIAPQLAKELEALKILQLLGDKSGELQWFEMLRTSDATLPLPSQQAMQQLKQQGASVHLQTIVGEPFWATTEVVCIEPLISATTAALSGAHHD